MQKNKEIIKNSLRSPNFAKRLKLANNFEKYSGAGLLRKLKRMVAATKIYLPYLWVVKANQKRKSDVETELFWGRKIKLPIQDYDSLALSKFGFAGGTKSELKLVKYLIENIKPSDVFYDIGGNYGFFTYLSEELCNEVHAFEPNPELIRVIKINTKKNSKNIINEIALSDSAGFINLYMSESSGLSTINKETITIHTYQYKKSVKVKTETLDSYTQKHAKPTLMKIDVEGAEENVIIGGKNFLNNNSPIIAMEVWGKNNGWKISKRAVNVLKSLNYEPFNIKADGTISKVSGDLSSLIPENGGDNFIFKKI